MAKEKYPRCARCPTRACENRGAKASDVPDLEKAPNFCPMKLMPETLQEAAEEYKRSEVGDFARLASIQEFQCYERLPDGMRTRLPRVEELIQFARKCGYKRLGIAHCGGLFKASRLYPSSARPAGWLKRSSASPRSRRLPGRKPGRACAIPSPKPR